MAAPGSPGFSEAGESEEGAGEAFMEESCPVEARAVWDQPGRWAEGLAHPHADGSPGLLRESGMSTSLRGPRPPWNYSPSIGRVYLPRGSPARLRVWNRSRRDGLEELQDVGRWNEITGATESEAWGSSSAEPVCASPTPQQKR
ncbi:hypothetical protein Kosp01_07820 [Kocuria sp. NBRC 114282]|nr:hypothetical protein Kosp01_07820 [Kocuria sp. NBRC 114282]